jgi:hypothetical protein
MKVLIALTLVASLSAQHTSPPDRSRGPRSPELETVNRDQRVAWYGVWDQALAEAKRTGQPILLMSAAPRCNGVPGMW